MPIRSYLEGATFDPEAIRVMTEAYEDVCRTLDLVNRNDPITEMVAKRIIEIAKLGERDPVILRKLALIQLAISK